MPTTEQVASGVETVGKVIEAGSPLLAAIPVGGPIAALIGQLVGEGIELAGQDIAATAEQEAEIVAALQVALDKIRTTRKQTADAHAARTAETQRQIDAAMKPPALPTPAAEPHAVPVAAGGESLPIVETLKRDDEKTKQGG